MITCTLQRNFTVVKSFEPSPEILSNRNTLTVRLRLDQGHQRAIPSWAVEWDVVAQSKMVFKVLKMESNKHFILDHLPLQVANLEVSFRCIIIDQVYETYVPGYEDIANPEGVGLLQFFFNNASTDILTFVLRHQPKYRTGISLLTAILSTLLLGRDVVSSNDYDRLFLNNQVPCENFQLNARMFLRLMHERWKCTGTFQISIGKYLDLCTSSSREIYTRSELDIIGKTINTIFGFETGAPQPTDDELLQTCGTIIPPADAINFSNKTPFGLHATQMAALKSKGGFIGAGRAGTMRGDVICVLRDADVPFILRPVEGGKCRLVGPCYVEGLMDGEAWEMVCAGERVVQTIGVV